MRATCQKIDGFLVGSEEDHKGRHIVTAYLNAIPVTRFNKYDNAERRKAAIELVELELCTKNTAANICGFHRNTVSNLVKTKQLLGLEAAIREERGRREPVKYIESIQSHVIQLLESYPDWSDRRIAEQASLDLNMEVTRIAVARIRTRNDPPKTKQSSKQEILDMEKTAEDICKEHSVEKQLKLPLEFDSELKQKQEELSHTAPPEAKTKTEEKFIEDLQEGKRIPFAGELMHNLFLQEIGIEELLSGYPYQTGACYQAVDILGTVFHSINLGFPSIESLKLVNAGDLGVLIGQRRAPEKETLRDRLGDLASYEQSPQLIHDLARGLLDQQRIDKEVFFIDGHFLPYFGMHIIAKGYYTVRRMAMKGNELYAITDLNGRPLFFLTESCEVDFRPMIARSAEMLLDLGFERPMLVFDRGGFGINFFKELDSKADFVTALDFSSQMIAKAQAKVEAENVTFKQTDITAQWPVKPGWSNLITCSLVLEHIGDLRFIFREAARVLKRRGKFYICELHPWKQYQGKQARFETEDGTHKPMVFVHHISDYLNAARAEGFHLLDLHEYFDEEQENIPRLISLVFESEK